LYSTALARAKIAKEISDFAIRKLIIKKGGGYFELRQFFGYLDLGGQLGLTF
jgi:hypothetical protein